MDHEVLMAHRNLWGHEALPLRRELVRLTSAEMSVYDDLRDNRLATNLRLEQEHIGIEWLHTRAEAM